jgi:hypothetical protein
MKSKRFLGILAAFLIGYAVANVAARLFKKDEAEGKRTTAVESEKAQQESQTSVRSDLPNEAHGPDLSGEATVFHSPGAGH